MPIRQVLNKATIKAAYELDEAHLEIVKDELNVKKVEYHVLKEPTDQVEVTIDTMITLSFSRKG